MRNYCLNGPLIYGWKDSKREPEGTNFWDCHSCYLFMYKIVSYIVHYCFDFL